MDFNAEYRTLVRRFFCSAGWNPTLPFAFLNPTHAFMEAKMGKGLLLWLVGVPIPVIILLWLFFGR